MRIMLDASLLACCVFRHEPSLHPGTLGDSRPCHLAGSGDLVLSVKALVLDRSLCKGCPFAVGNLPKPRGAVTPERSFRAADPNISSRQRGVCLHPYKKAQIGWPEPRKLTLRVPEATSKIRVCSFEGLREEPVLGFSSWLIDGHLFPVFSYQPSPVHISVSTSLFMKTPVTG